MYEHDFADDWTPPANVDATYPGDALAAADYIARHGAIEIPELGDPEGAYARDPGE